MPIPVAPEVTLTQKQRNILERLARRPTSPQRLARRCQLILQMAAGTSNAQIARQQQRNRGRVRHWRTRWREAAERLTAAAAAGADDKTLTPMIEAVLGDAPRPGAPPTFTPEQVVHIVALACEVPADRERPVSHWTPRELAAEAVKRGFVERISPRSVGRFLKGGGGATPSGALLAAPARRGHGSVRDGGESGV